MSDGLLIRSSSGEYAVDFAEAGLRLRDEPPTSVVVVDEALERLHGRRLAALAGRQRVIRVAADEETKTAEYALHVVEQIVAIGFRRNERLVAVGGGVVQDLTGFIASVLYRGVDWVFYPTTLLAQADSCIGGKTSINVRGFKNLLGTFHPPARIVLDTGFLETLPPRELRSGIGEMLHYFLLADWEAAQAIAVGYDDLLADVRRLVPFIRASLEIKKKVIEVDEFDRGPRTLFNYGHTFGHALESASDYAVSHGEAVAWGMDLANELSWRLGMLDEPTLDRMRRVLTRCLPSYILPEERLDRYFAALHRDKKHTASTLVCILSRGPGRMEKVELPADERLRTTVTDYVRRAASWAG